MLRVALTGGVGSGKSAVAAMLRDLGAQVSQSDEVGRALMRPGEAVFDAIVKRFGSEVLSAAGSLDRAVLARLAFADGRLEELNAIVHPAVIAAQARWMDSVAAAAPLAVAVVESALVFETRYGSEGQGASGGPLPWRSRFDRIVVVVSPEPMRRQRYIARLAGSNLVSNTAAASADFDRRAAAQWSDERKEALADFVLRNEESLDDLRDEAQRLYDALRQESADRAIAAM